MAVERVAGVAVVQVLFKGIVYPGISVVKVLLIGIVRCYQVNLKKRLGAVYTTWPQ